MPVWQEEVTPTYLECTKRSFRLSENFVTKLLPTEKGMHMAYLAKSLHKGRH
jgi:hypothetical protein